MLKKMFENNNMRKIFEKRMLKEMFENNNMRKIFDERMLKKCLRTITRGRYLRNGC
jgi:hypothetical protein